MYLHTNLQLISTAYFIWSKLLFYKNLVKPWDVDRGGVREAHGTLGRECDGVDWVISQGVQVTVPTLCHTYGAMCKVKIHYTMMNSNI
jgi:hypothetical protein